MVAMDSLISAFLQANAKASKSTILGPFIWAAASVIVLLIFGVAYHAPTWLLAAVFVLLVLELAAMAVAFFYCLLSKRENLVDALRTERYSIQKLEIEKGFRGDSLTGTTISVTGSSQRIESGNDQFGER